HRGRPRRRGRAACAAGRVRRDRRRTVRLLHAGDPDERVGAARARGSTHPRIDRTRALRESLPLHRLHQDLRSGGARRAPPSGSEAMSEPGERSPRRGAEVPAGRMMPKEERLTPPRWEGGRANPPDAQFHVIGKRQRKIEGLAKVTGRAVYTDDLVLPRMLHAKLKRSIHAHARILSIDASEALAMPGVHAVITGKDLPTHFGIIPWTEDEQALAAEKVGYVGDA